MLALLNVIAGISWEPEIRGALVVLVGSAVLMGSVWLILTTNVGSRVGTLNAVAGFFGWMFIMGVVWWIYGIGLLGDDPTWEPKEFVFGELEGAVTGNVDDLADAVFIPAPDLVDRYCPGLVDATVEVQRARVVENNLDLVLVYAAPEPYCTEQVGELLAVDGETIAEDIIAENEALGPDDPRYLEGEELEEAIATEIDDQRRRRAQLTLSTLKSGAAEMIEQAEDEGVLDFQGWNLQSSAEAGEAIASADAALVASSDVPFAASSEFFVLSTFQQGGKPDRESDSTWDRVWNEVRNTAVFWHPTNTVVVQVAPTLDKPTVEGQAPPFAEIDPDGQVVSVAMVRDLGNRRLPAALTTIGSLIIFLVLAWMLHVRDVELRHRLDEWDPAAAT